MGQVLSLDTKARDRSLGEHVPRDAHWSRRSIQNAPSSSKPDVELFIERGFVQALNRTIVAPLALRFLTIACAFWPFR